MTPTHYYRATQTRFVPCEWKSTKGKLATVRLSGWTRDAVVPVDRIIDMHKGEEFVKVGGGKGYRLKNDGQRND